MTFSNGGEPPPPRATGLAASTGWFCVLLGLAVIWPDPIRWVNDRWLDLPLRMDHRSFLGREAPEWDLAYWCIAGLFAIRLLHGRLDAFAASASEVGADCQRLPGQVLRYARALSATSLLRSVVSFVLGTVIVWYALDMMLIAFGESFQNGTSRVFVRVFNRLGGGMNPVMIVVFVLLAGMAHGNRFWRVMGIAMAGASLASGLIVNGIKLIVGRSRPEVWLGPFHFSDAASTSFPSGHTVGVFAIAGVLMAARTSPTTRIIALLLASGVGVARVLSYRHWPSDVLASAVLGLALGMVFMQAAKMEDRV